MSDTYQFEMPAHHKSIIKVIGVGGGGSNAVGHMYVQGIKDVEFIVANTDMQALKSNAVPNKVQIGTHLTEGLGAGAKPEVGREAAIESKEEIREILGTDTKMVFITAGMGGGTGTGAAPVIAEIAKELGILTVGIVTAPFSYEGKRKMQYAEEGIALMKDNCDTVLVVLNDKLREVYGNFKFSEAFAKADGVLSTAAKSIAEIITVHSKVNVDFNDVNTVMKESGAAVMGSGVASGDQRARNAAEGALNSPLLNDADIQGAQKVLLSVTYSEEYEPTMDELGEITDYIQEQIGVDPDLLIPGYGIDTTLGEDLRVTVIATGFEGNDYDERPKYFELGTESQPSLFQKNDPKKAPAVEKKEEPVQDENRVEFTLDIESDASDEAEGFSTAAEEEQKRIQLESRRAKLRNLSSHELSDDEIKEKLDTPAYMRNNVKLDDVSHSSERDVSRFRLNDDDEILGDNKFLHDNVD